MDDPDTDLAASSSNRGKWALLVLVLLGLTLRVATVVYVQSRDPSFAVTPDTPGYIRPAQEVVSNVRFDSATDSAAIVRTPGYPLFLAVIFKVAGSESQGMVLGAQALIGSLVIPLVYLMFKRLANEGVALVAAGLCAIDPALVVSVARIMTDWLAAVVVLAFAYSAVRFFTDRSVSAPWALAMTSALVAATFVRPTTYWFVPLMVLFVIGWMVRLRPPVARVGLVVLALSPILLIGAWQGRNQAQGDTWRFSSIDAVNMYRILAPRVVGRAEGTAPKDADEDLRKRLPRMSGESEGAYYDRLFSAGFREITSHPKAYLEEVGSGLNTELFSGQLGTSAPSGLFRLFAAGLLTVVWVGCAVGVTSGLRNAQVRWATAFLATAIAFVVVASALATGGAAQVRYRLVVEPLVLGFFVMGGASVRRYLRARSSGRVPLAADAEVVADEPRLMPQVP